MRRNPFIGRLVLLIVLFSSLPAAADAQGIGARLKAKAQQRVEGKVDEAMDKALDGIENAVKCVTGDDACMAEAKQGGKKVVVTDDSGKILPPAKQPKDSPAQNAKAVAKANENAGKGDAADGEPAGTSSAASQSAPPPAPAAASRPGEGAWANFDFVPGERILFADDFARDRVGNFPQRLELVNGNLQMVESKGKRWLESSSLNGEIAVPLPENLPQRFTVEFDFTFPGNFPIQVYSGAKPSPDEFGEGSPLPFISFGPYTAGLHSGGRTLVDMSPVVNGVRGEELAGTPARARIHVDGKYVKVYINEQRIVNAPNGDLVRGNKLFIRMPYVEEHPVLIGDITVNAGGRDMYDALLADGRVVTQGILFDVGSDHIRPESTPTLQIIGDMLKQHADLKLAVEGHTDNTGLAATNQTLSEKRAAAIVAALKSTYSIDASRLQAKGFGASKPAKPNDTAEGRQQNRRVELVKLP